MENLDFNQSEFTWKGMIPEDLEELTPLWARKIVRNLANGYGIVGQVEIERLGVRVIGLNLRRSFVFPPTVFIYYKLRDGTRGLESNVYSNQFENYYSYQGYEGISISGHSRVRYLLDDDNLVLFNLFGNDVTVHYRVHGV